MWTSSTFGNTQIGTSSKTRGCKCLYFNVLRKREQLNEQSVLQRFNWKPFLVFLLLFTLFYLIDVSVNQADLKRSSLWLMMKRGTKTNTKWFSKVLGAKFVEGPWKILKHHRNGCTPCLLTVNWQPTGLIIFPIM